MCKERYGINLLHGFAGSVCLLKVVNCLCHYFAFHVLAPTIFDFSIDPTFLMPAAWQKRVKVKPVRVIPSCSFIFNLSIFTSDFILLITSIISEIGYSAPCIVHDFGKLNCLTFCTMIQATYFLFLRSPRLFCLLACLWMFVIFFSVIWSYQGGEGYRICV